MYKALDVLSRKVEIIGIFSDWPATVTYYANCMGLKQLRCNGIPSGIPGFIQARRLVS
jgi:hypothetical protein